MKHKKTGRPKAGEEGEKVGIKVESVIKQNKKSIEAFLNRKGRFILATNDLDNKKFPDEQMLEEYKQQQDVECGFRFLKDPWFMVDSIFLKSPKRIEALMMTLCLMVYNIAQHRLREALEKKQETLPNQINKPVKNPTMRWIFQIMEGIGLVRFYEKHIEKPVREVITNLDVLQRKIIMLLGRYAQEIYGIV